GLEGGGRDHRDGRRSRPRRGRLRDDRKGPEAQRGSEAPGVACWEARRAAGQDPRSTILYLQVPHSSRRQGRARAQERWNDLRAHLERLQVLSEGEQEDLPLPVVHFPRLWDE